MNGDNHLGADRSPRSVFIQPNDLRLHYVEFPAGSNAAAADSVGALDPIPVLFVHGAFGHARLWDFVASYLPRSLRVFAIDLPGHGESDRAASERYAFGHLVDDIRTVIDALPAKPMLVGHSIGGALAARFAATHPTDIVAVAVLDIDPHPPPYQIEHLNAVGSRPPRSWAQFDDVLARAARAAPEADGAIHRHLASHSYRSVAGRYSEKFDHVFLRDLALWDERARLPDITVPALLLRGGETTVMTDSGVEDFERGVVDLERVTIDGGTHQLHLERPEAVAAAIADFASRRVAPLAGGGSARGELGSR